MNNKILVVGEPGMGTSLLIDALNRQEGLIVIDNLKRTHEETIEIKRINIEHPPFMIKKEDERVRREKLMKNFSKFKRKRK